jgi:hypothetical protein
MAGSDGVFGGLSDPSVPELVTTTLDDGTDAIDAVASAENRLSSMAPQIRSSDMIPGDVLVVDFDDKHVETFEVTAISSGSLVFGTDDVVHQAIALKRQTPDGAQEPEAIRLYGSAMSPDGLMQTPGAVRAGAFMVSEEGISPTAISTFDLKRRGDDGELRSVVLNRKEAKPMSDSFAHARRAFEGLTALLEREGFNFTDEDDDGLFERYKNVSGNLLVQAAREGFGCGVIPQDEIWVYDAGREVLRAIRNVPTLGVIQVAMVEGVTTEAFQKATIAYRDGNTPDWRYPFLSGPALHRLSEFVPITTYTWMRPEQETPVITLLENGERVSEMFRTPMTEGVALAESMRAHGADDLIESASELVGVDPDGGDPIYEPLEVNLYPGLQEPLLRSGDNYRWYRWTSRELAEAFEERVRQELTLVRHGDRVELHIDGHILSFNEDPHHAIDDLTAAARLGMGVTTERVGTRGLRSLLPRRYRHLGFRNMGRTGTDLPGLDSSNKPAGDTPPTPAKDRRPKFEPPGR